MVSGPLGVVAQSVIGSSQVGGVSGRFMGDHIIDLESKLVKYVVTRSKFGGIIAIDQRTAFPALSRDFLFWVFRNLGVPRRILKVIKSLYSRCFGTISIGGKLFSRIPFNSGVKQGDPSSMVLFVLAFDPILRFIAHGLTPFDTHVFGMCDDTALATENIIDCWKKLIPIFSMVTRFSCLSLNLKKTQILFADRAAADLLRDTLLSIDAQLSTDNFKDFVRYLGICIGPGADSVQWIRAARSYMETIRFIRALSAGRTTSIVLYNILVHSKLMFIASFAAPNRVILELERYGQQIITCGPYFAYPPKLLQNMKRLGFRVETASLELSSIAARCRNARFTPSNFEKTCDFLDTLQNPSGSAVRSSEAALEPPLGEWRRNTCLNNLKDALLVLQRIGFNISALDTFKKRMRQRRILNAITLAGPEPPLKHILQIRLARFLPGVDHSADIDRLFHIHRRFNS